MANFKFKIIFLNIVSFLSLSVQARECRDYFEKSDFVQNHQLSMQQFRFLESLAFLEISASHIENVLSKSASLEEVKVKLAEMVQAGVSITAYPEIKRLILRDMKRKKELEEKRLRELEKKLEESRIDGRRAVFHRIEPGTFLMGEMGEQVLTTISQPFELMATQTTQIIWRTIAELANSKLSGKYHINIDPSKFKGDTRPVESVSAEEVEIWINALNDLSQLGDSALAELIVGHKKGDMYRLPWAKEWEFVIRGRGKYNDVYYFGNDKEVRLDEHAWFSANSDKKTHPVAQKPPLVIDGNKEFFDMCGNVWERMAGKFSLDSDESGEGVFRAFRGGGYTSDAQYLTSGGHYKLFHDAHEADTGFRLLRTSN